MTKNSEARKPIIKMGKVVGNSKYAEGTLKVRVDYTLKNKKYNKIIKRHTNFLVQYDDKKPVELGVKVLIEACAPISKYKNFKVIKILGEKNVR